MICCSGMNEWSRQQRRRSLLPSLSGDRLTGRSTMAYIQREDLTAETGRTGTEVEEAGLFRLTGILTAMDERGKEGCLKAEDKGGEKQRIEKNNE